MVKVSIQDVFNGHQSFTTKTKGPDVWFVERDRDKETGKFSEEYPDEDFLKAVESLEFPSTNDVADVVGCSYTLAYHRLNALEEKEKVTKVEVGNSFVWTKE